MKNHWKCVVFLSVFGPVAAVGGYAQTTTAPAGATPATLPAAWGKEESGLRSSLAATGEIALGQKLILHMALRNTTEQPIALKDAFVWIFVAQGKEKAFYSERLEFSKILQDTLTLPPEKDIALDLDLTGKGAFLYQQDLTVVGGYPKAEAAELTSVGTLQDRLPVGKVRARAMVYVPAKSALVPSNTLELIVADGEVRTMSPEARQGLLADLLGRFDKDPFAAKNAHDRAVKIGKEIAPDLTAAVNEKRASPRPDFAQMWLATTLIDLNDAGSVDTLLRLEESGSAGVKNVIAYHGPKMNNKKMDEAIIAAAGKDATVAAWAARGFAVFNRGLRDDLLDEGMKSPDPETRANLAEALVYHPTEKGMARLAKLLTDPEPGVRGPVAQTVAKTNLRSAKLVAAMVDGLALPGDGARAALAGALEKMTGHAAPYDPKGTSEEKQKVLADWKHWWLTEGKDFK